MPCSDGMPTYRTVYERGHDPHYQELYREERTRSAALKARCDLIADLLCKAGRAKYAATNIPGEVIDWWREHCRFDASRGEPWPVEPPPPAPAAPTQDPRAPIMPMTPTVPRKPMKPTKKKAR